MTHIDYFGSSPDDIYGLTNRPSHPEVSAGLKSNKNIDLSQKTGTISAVIIECLAAYGFGLTDMDVSRETGLPLFEVSKTLTDLAALGTIRTELRNGIVLFFLD